jgi:hypothetical protein
MGIRAASDMALEEMEKERAQIDRERRKKEEREEVEEGEEPIKKEEK